jgi:Tfp pilus assembly protein PilN
VGINLLPAQDLRNYYDKEAIAPHIMIGVCVPLLLIAILFFAASKIRQSKEQTLRAIEQQYQNYIDTEREITRLQQDTTLLKQRAELLKSILPAEFYWSEKLLLLARLIPAEAWLDKLSIQGKAIQVNGYVFAENTNERPIAILNRFIKSLSSETEFSNDFSTIDLVDTFITKIKEKEVLEFRLQMILK